MEEAALGSSKNRAIESLFRKAGIQSLLYPFPYARSPLTQFLICMGISPILRIFQKKRLH